MCFYFFALFFKLISCTNTAILPKIWDHIFKTVFPELFFCFLCKAKKCLETCVNCVWNCVTPLSDRGDTWSTSALKIFSQRMTGSINQCNELMSDKGVEQPGYTGSVNNIIGKHQLTKVEVWKVCGFCKELNQQREGQLPLGLPCFIRKSSSPV